MTFDPQKHNRTSTRLRGYDYSLAGAYFITLVTYQREMLFGEIVGGNMKLHRQGEIVQEEWFRSAEIRKEIRLFPDEFVVMPNHVHGIVWIVENDVLGENVGATAPCGDASRAGRPYADRNQNHCHHLSPVSNPP